MNRLACESMDLSIAGIRVVKKFNFEMKPGCFWGLLGSNGAGKTTLLKTMAGLGAPQAGKITFQSRPIDELPRRLLARHIGMLQQHTVYVFDSSVLQTALTGRHPHLAYWQREGPEDIDKAMAALEAVDLCGFAERSVTGLSGGEARRLAFASLLVQNPDIMLLDEPTNHLDLRHQVQIMEMIRKRTMEENGGAIAALHDVNLAARYCSHVLMLFGDGEWAAGRTGEMLETGQLEKLYRCPVERLSSPSGPRFFPTTA